MGIKVEQPRDVKHHILSNKDVPPVVLCIIDQDDTYYRAIFFDTERDEKVLKYDIYDLLVAYLDHYVKNIKKLKLKDGVKKNNLISDLCKEPFVTVEKDELFKFSIDKLVLGSLDSRLVSPEFVFSQDYDHIPEEMRSQFEDATRKYLVW